jgi:copper(I)-binding protein
MRATFIVLAGMFVSAAQILAAPTPEVISVRDAIIRPAAPGQPMTAAYMTLVSADARPLRLTSVRCACAGMVSPHESKLVNGVMTMRPATAVVVPPHGSISFQPGGLHLMVMDLKRAIHPGDRVSMSLTFDRGAPIAARFLARR